jgi:elongation factor G
MTVDRQMRRYNVPRVAFINKCDRSGADPYKVLPPTPTKPQTPNKPPRQVLSQIKDKLRLSCAFTTLPIGLEDKLSGLIDLVRMRAVYFEGDSGTSLRYSDVPPDMADAAKAARRALVEAVGEVDEEMGDMFLAESDPNEAQLEAAIRRATVKTAFVPVLMGSA